MPTVAAMERMLVHYGEMLESARGNLARATSRRQRAELQQIVESREEVVERTKAEIEHARRIRQLP